MADIIADVPDTSAETQDTGDDTSVDAGLKDFLIDDPGEETEFTPGEEPEAVDENSDEEEKVEAEGKEGEEKKDEPKEELKWTVKVNGKEFDVDEQELIRGYQIGQAANQKFQEAAALRGQAEKLVEVLQKDPLKILLNPALKIDFRKIAEEYLIEQIKQEQSSPEEKAQREAERRFKELQENNERLAKEQEEAQIKAEQEVWTRKIDEAYTAALSKGKVPKTPTVVRRMAELNQQMLDQGYDPEADELVDMVRKEIILANKEIMGQLPPDELEKFLGADKMKEVRKSDLAKAKPQSKAQQVKQFKPAANSAPKRYISERELAQHIKKTVGR